MLDRADRRGVAIRAAIAAVAAVAVAIIAARTGGWFAAAPGEFQRNIDRERLLLPFLLAPALFALMGVVRHASRPAWAAFGAWTLYLGLWLFALWPGIVMTDTHSAVSSVRGGIMNEWFSWLHAYLVMASMDVVPEVWFMAILQVLGTAATMAYASHALLQWRRSIPAVVAMNVLAALAVPIATNAVLLSRDTPFALAHVVLAIGVARVVTRQAPATRGTIAWIALLTGALSVYRGDGIALAIVVPLLLLMLRPARRTALLAAGAFAASVVLFHVALPSLFRIEDQSRAYTVSLRINPLGAILRTNFYSPDMESDLEGLGHVVDVQALKDMHQPNEIPAFWAGKWNPNATEAQFEAFKGITNRLFVHNAATTLSNRFETFMGATGMNYGQFAYPEISRELRYKLIASPEGIVADPPSPGLYDAFVDALQFTREWRGAISVHSFVWWNFLPALALLVAVLALWRRLPFLAVIAVVLLCRVPLVFLASPAAQFKYYLSVEIGGIVVAGMLLAAFHRRSRPPDAAAATVPVAA